MNKLLGGLTIIFMPLAISNISFSSNYGELYETISTLTIQQELVLERTGKILMDIESIKAENIETSKRIESLRRAVSE
ncbi:TPA: hypothetical protein ACPVZ9_001520 [Vibrio parahaemolyticus]